MLYSIQIPAPTSRLTDVVTTPTQPVRRARFRSRSTQQYTYTLPGFNTYQVSRPLQLSWRHMKYLGTFPNLILTSP